MGNCNYLKKKPVLFGLFLSIFVISLVFSSCDMGIGMGKEVDLEPPTLMIDPGPNPRFINASTVISGSCFDNVAVTRITAVGLVDGEAREFGKNLVINNSTNRWNMELDVTEELNGQRILLTITAFDAVGNSGEDSIQNLTIIVDVRDPVFSNLMLWRSDTRFTRLEPLSDLVDIGTEFIDGIRNPNYCDGSRFSNVERYQNGAFQIKAQLMDRETPIDRESVTLYIYDAYHDNEGEYLIEKKTTGGTIFTPEWFVTEQELIDAAAGRGWDYETVLAGGGRLYFRVTATAKDRADNIARDDFGYFCVFRTADIPKAAPLANPRFLDLRSQIPVFIFDDDLIGEAYVGLLTESQFVSYGPGLNDEERMDILLQKFKAGETVYNWIRERHYNESSGNYGTSGYTDDDAIFKNLAGSNSEQLHVNVLTGTTEKDYGDYVLVMFVVDKKSAPHNTSTSAGIIETRAQPIWVAKHYQVTIVDKNNPLIVIDTTPGSPDPIPGASTGNSPEENTFPILYAINGGQKRYFDINGYTLDEDTNGRGRVDLFRMAWIPYKEPGYQEERLEEVKQALRLNNSDANSLLDTLGVQYWTLSNFTNHTQPSYFIDGTREQISSSWYGKQVFRKRFDIMGGPDNLNPAWRNFHKPGCQNPVHNISCVENEPKLFVLYARDLDGNGTFRTIRLLGNTAPPQLNIYDLSGKVNLNDPIFQPSIDVNDQFKYHNAIKAISRDDADLMTEPFYAYPRGTTLVLLVEGNEHGGLPITEILMNDRIEARQVGHYENNILTYIAVLDGGSPQKMFEFEAINELNIETKIQRTAAVLSTAMLNEIIAEQTSGTYPKGTVINIKAHFTDQVIVLPGIGNQGPALYLRYEKSLNNWEYADVPFTGNFNEPTMYLEFDWVVPEGALGRLETFSTGAPGWVTQVPISLRGGSSIMDATSDNIRAFMPPEFPWSLNQTLQYRKAIRMDGLAPELESITVTGKAPDQDDGHYYFRDGDTITFNLRMKSNPDKGNNNQIRPESDTNMPNPRLVFRIIEEGGVERPVDFFANYQNPSGNQGMDFSFVINSTTLPDSTFVRAARAGQIVIKGINTAEGRIVDPAGNELNTVGIGSILTQTLRVDKRVPGPSTPTINGAAPIASYNGQPILRMPPADSAELEPWGVNMQYSFDGFEWVEFPQPRAGWTTNIFYEGTNEITLTDSLVIVSGRFPTFMTRQVDKAGNQGVAYRGALEIIGDFPRISDIRSTNTDGFQIPVGPNPPTINILLDFSHRVRTTNPANAYIIVADRSRNLAVLESTLNGYGTITALTNYIATQDDLAIIHPQVIPNDGATSLLFRWQPVNKEMANGIIIARIRLLGGVEDIYTNPAVNSSSAASSPGVGTITINYPGSPPVTRTNLNGAGIKVFTKPVTLVNSSPTNAFTPTGMSLASTAVLSGNKIELTFNSAMQKGMGTITIRPRECDGTLANPGSCAYNSNPAIATHNFNCRNMIPIPPVFPANSYTQDGIYYPSFHEIYNSLDDTGKGVVMRQRLGPAVSTTVQTETGAGTYDNPTLDARTALHVGPYRLTTQGLVQGLGFTGNATVGSTPVLVEGSDPHYTIDGTRVTNPGWYTVGSTTVCNHPTSVSCDHYLVPDITGKFVLDYQFAITETIWSYNPTTGALVEGAVIHSATDMTRWNYANTTTQRRQVILNIRNALSRAKFRWVEMEVASGNISINECTVSCLPGCSIHDRKTVTIELESPLPKGMRWDITWTPGALTNEAGVPASVDPNWWFWSDGVQAPIIRVDRKSLDHRQTVTQDIDEYSVNATAEVSLTNGFNSIGYRYESETPGVIIHVGTLIGSGNMRQEIAWTGTTEGNVPWTSGGWNASNNHPAPFTTATNGNWLRSNLLRKTIVPGGATVNTLHVPNPGIIFYEIENDILVRRQGQGNLRMLRSYNRDITLGELRGLINPGTATASTVRVDAITGIPVRVASKNYVAAWATPPHNGNRAPGLGYEGVFKTVVAVLNGSVNEPNNSHINFDSNQFVAIGGGTNADGSTSVPGFPLMVGAVDSRYVRFMALDTTNMRRIWISTEVVSPMYVRFVSRRDGSSAMAQPWTILGEVGPYMSGGYGDLTYSFGQDRKN